MNNTTQRRRGDELYIRHGSGFIAVRLTQNSNIAGKPDPRINDLLDRDDLSTAELIDMIKDGKSLYAFLGPNGRFVADAARKPPPNPNAWRKLFTAADVSAAYEDNDQCPLEPIAERADDPRAWVRATAAQEDADRESKERIEIEVLAQNDQLRFKRRVTLSAMIACGMFVSALIAWSQGAFSVKVTYTDTTATSSTSDESE